MNIVTPIIGLGLLATGVAAGVMLREHEVLTADDLKNGCGLLSRKVRTQVQKLRDAKANSGCAAEPQANN